MHQNSSLSESFSYFDETLEAPGVTELTVVVPTLNERDNIVPLLELLERALVGIRWEVLFVDDDSIDCTADRVRLISRRDPRVRCLQRIGRRGLSGACIEGTLASSAPYVAIMDADLQHDERLLPTMLQTLKQEPYDVVVGSRYVAGGGVGNWDRTRKKISGLATSLSRWVCNIQIADPMSGFFMFRREVFAEAAHSLSGKGFKILLDILASSPRRLAVKEIPFQFRQRQHGTSKLDSLVAWEFAMLLADKLIGHIVPVRFVLFALVGVLGVLIHLGMLWTALKLGAVFTMSQAIATVTAMTANFFLNNLLTYRDQRLTGRGLFSGLLSFYLSCSIGAVANVAIASYIFAAYPVWWLAGMCGAVMGSIWNYALSSTLTWNSSSRPATTT